MRLTPAAVHKEYEWVQERGSEVVPLVNETRAHLGSQFDVNVDRLTDDAYTAAIGEVFADGDRAVNVAALVRLLRELDVESDYPGFVVDELLGRELAAMIAGGQPLRLLAEATFHVADVRTHGDDTETAGADDLDAALAAGVQTRVPGWPWQRTESPFAVE
ncbi:hypothetical protein Har1130_10335 [Haloarcula sp. CBA1130]|uniref:hypothetical protein n=1 Tax=unclassified Haloarcula TaxID=2624677 RepID=UPI0012457E2C|nr:MULTISPECIES: hypothetical protein [unclassified Haloarcula]KAA9398607.1 hypothetical protein Har1129_10430 [Haloarcula sp. CBA1129]KAA9403124.1 hypothetical protein Har1130_10335 [Haloarcula sp. CBA1130]